MQEFGAPLTIVTYVLCVALGFGLYFILTKLGVSKAHNDANMLSLGERVLGRGLALEIVDAWINTEFEGDRH